MPYLLGSPDSNAKQMKHWANTYVFDHAAASSHQNGKRDLQSSVTQQPPQPPSAAVAESHHESSHHTNSAHWSSIVDPYSEHGPAISVHDGKLYTFPSALDAPNNDADDDPIRHPPELSWQANQNQKAASTSSPCMPQQMPLDETKYKEKLMYDEKISPDPRGWYGQQKDCDWYGATVRTANKTPLHVLGYQSEHDEDDCSDQGPVMNKEKSLISLGKESNQASGIGIIQNNPCTASCHDTRAEHNKKSRKMIQILAIPMLS